MASLILRNATLPDGRAGVDILCDGDRIAAVGPKLAAQAATTIDARGLLVTPPFVDAHFHIDSALTYGMPRVNASGTLLEGIALGSSAQIALFVAPVLVLLSYVIGPAPMDLRMWPGAIVMMLIAALTAALVTNSGRSAWFVGVLVLVVYLIFAMTLYLLPPGAG